MDACWACFCADSCALSRACTMASSWLRMLSHVGRSRGFYVVSDEAVAREERK